MSELLKPSKFPYRIPCYLIPEIFQWCTDNGIPKVIKYHFDKKEDTIGSYSTSFYVDLNSEYAQKMFNLFLNQNRFKFWIKKRRYYKIFRKCKSIYKTFGEYQMDVNQDELFIKFHKFVISMNKIFPKDLWAFSMTPSFFNFELGTHSKRMIFTHITIFKNSDQNLFKLINP